MKERERKRGKRCEIVCERETETSEREKRGERERKCVSVCVCERETIESERYETLTN